MSAPAGERHLTAVLHRLAGPSAAPRADQLAAVAAIQEPAARVHVVYATGWGNSADFQAVDKALHRRTGNPR
ncbi:MAG: hypothetical protein ACK5R1_08355 [Planctomycetota bacterium]